MGLAERRYAPDKPYRADRQTEGQTEGQTDRRIEGRTDEQTDRLITVRRPQSGALRKTEINAKTCLFMFKPNKQTEKYFCIKNTGTLNKLARAFFTQQRLYNAVFCLLLYNLHSILG